MLTPYKINSCRKMRIVEFYFYSFFYFWKPHPLFFPGSFAISSFNNNSASFFGLFPLGANGSRAQLIVIRALTAGFTCRIFTPQSSLILAAQLMKRLDTEEGGEEGAKEVVGVLKLQKDTYTGEITGEFSRGK